MAQGYSTGDYPSTGVLSYGSATGVQEGSTGIILSSVAAPGVKIAAVTVSGDSDGTFVLLINSSPRLSLRTSITVQTITAPIPSPIILEDGDTLVLQVTNNGHGAGSFQGTIHKE